MTSPDRSPLPMISSGGASAVDGAPASCPLADPSNPAQKEEHPVKRPTTLSALVLTTALVLAGCGAGGGDTTGAAPETAVATATSDAPAEASGETITEEHDDADVMFARMMIPHHEQAVEMSEVLLDKDGIPEGVRDFAQGPEIERMNAMLTAWGEEFSTDAGAGGADHGSMDHGAGSGMGGMTTAEDMQALEAAEGGTAVRLYLEQMIVHHEGAIDMARDEVANGRNPQALELAGTIAEDQEAEIQQIERMLQELPSGS